MTVPPTDAARPSSDPRIGEWLGRIGLHRWLRRHVALVVVLIGLGYLVIYPALTVLRRSFGQGGELTVEGYRAVATMPALSQVLWTTLTVVVIGVLTATALGATTAWLVERSDMPLRRHLAYAPMLPLIISPLVMAIGYVFLFDPVAGYANVVLRAMVGSQARSGPLDIYSSWGVGFVIGIYASAYVYPYVRAGLVSLDGSFEEAGRVSGGGRARVVFGLTLPLLRPALVAGVLMAVIVCISEFAIPMILGTRAGVRVVAVEIFRFVRGYPSNPVAGASLSLLITLITLIGLIPVYRTLRRSKRYEVVGVRGYGSQVSLGRWRWPAAAMVIGFVLLAAVLPLLALTVVALTPFWQQSPGISDLTLGNFDYILNEHAGTWLAVRNSVVFSLAASVLAILVAFTINFYRQYSRAGRRFSALADLVATLPLGMPGIVLGVGFLFMFLNGPLILYGTALALILAYFAKFIPFAQRSIASSFAQLRTELVEASWVSGAGNARTIGSVIAPLSSPGIVAGWWLMVIVMLREFPISILLFTRDTHVMSVELFNLFDGHLFGRVAAYALVVFAVGIALTAVIAVIALPILRWTKH